MSEEDKDLIDKPESPERRALLAKAGRFAAATPAALVVLLSTTKDADATHFMRSGGGYTKRRKKKIKKIRKIVKRKRRKYKV